MITRAVVRETLIWGLIALAAGFGVNLWRVNSALNARNREIVRQATDPLPGTFVPQIQTWTTEGEPAVLGQEGELQLLFFFNETCPYCRASTPAWAGIAGRLHGGVPVYGVSFDSTVSAATFKETHKLPFPVVSRPSTRFAALYRIPSVPLVMVVRPDGRIGYSRKGLLETEAAIDSILTAVDGLMHADANPQSLKGVASSDRPW